MKIAASSACPCGRDTQYKRCCGLLHRGHPPPTPESLMRSRYTAFALGKVTYLMDTVHPDSPHFNADRKAWTAELGEYCKSVSFLGLVILGSGVDSEQRGWVHFRAQLQASDGVDLSFAERSTFAKHKSRWTYLAGEIETV